MGFILFVFLYCLLLSILIILYILFDFLVVPCCLFLIMNIHSHSVVIS